jgi:hypothetical protein
MTVSAAVMKTICSSSARMDVPDRAHRSSAQADQPTQYLKAGVTGKVYAGTAHLDAQELAL